MQSTILQNVNTLSSIDRVFLPSVRLCPYPLPYLLSVVISFDYEYTLVCNFITSDRITSPFHRAFYFKIFVVAFMHSESKAFS